MPTTSVVARAEKCDDICTEMVDPRELAWRPEEFLLYIKQSVLVLLPNLSSLIFLRFLLPSKHSLCIGFEVFQNHLTVSTVQATTVMYSTAVIDLIMWLPLFPSFCMRLIANPQPVSTNGKAVDETADFWRKAKYETTIGIASHSTQIMVSNCRQSSVRTYLGAHPITHIALRGSGASCS